MAEEEKFKEGIDIRSLKVGIVTTAQTIRGNIRVLCRDLEIKHCFSYKNTHEALEGVHAEKLDLVITDWNVGADAAGIDMIETIRKDESLYQTACIVMSGEISEEQLASAVDIEVDEFLTLPFTAQAMKAAIVKALNKRKNPSEYEQAIIDAKFRINEKKYDEALVFLNKATGLNKRPANAHYFMGYIYLVFQDHDRALEQFNKALSYRNLHLKSLYGKAFILKSRDNDDEYLQALDGILKVFPTHASSYFELFRVYMKKKDYAKAAERLLYLFKVRSDFPKVNSTIEKYACVLIEFMCRGGKNLEWYQSAAPMYKAFANSNETFSVNYVKTLHRLKLEDEFAQEYVRHEMAFGPNQEIEFMRVQLMFKEEKFGQAVDVSRKLIDKFGADKPTLKMVMECFKKLGDEKRYQIAKEEYNSFLAEIGEAASEEEAPEKKSA